VEKLAGMPFIDYLYPRLLAPIGASEGIACIQSPEGYSFGGSGVLCEPLDLARVALLCLNEGKWGEKQLVDGRYIREATSRQVNNTLTNEDINSQQGYGYQFWRTRNNGFAFNGMGSQYAICLPDADMVVVTTGDTQGFASAGHAIFEAVWRELLPSLGDDKLAEDPYAAEELAACASSLALPVVPGLPASPAIPRVGGVTYKFNGNPLNIISARFEFTSDEVAMTYEKPNGVHKLAFGVGRLAEQPFPETHYSGMRIGRPANRGYETRASAAWADENTLIAKAYITDDYFGSFNMNATFKGDELTLLMTKNAEDFLCDYEGFAAGRSE